MHIPQWKKWLSYITEIHLESSHSEHNESLHVSLSKGRLQLSTDDAIYSFADKYQNFLLAFEKIELPDDHSEILVLGFGLGSIPFMLETIFNKDYRYTGVELDEEVIYLASKYVLDDLKSDVLLIEADAINYVKQNTLQYDLICIDIFVGDKIPEAFLTRDFIRYISSCLAKEGIVVFNHLANTESSANDAEEYFENVFKSVFPSSTCHQILGNDMMIHKS